MRENTNSTYTVDISRKWLDLFLQESIIQDAHRKGECHRDQCEETMLHRIQEFVDTAPIKKMEKIVRYELTMRQLKTVHEQAEWYDYMWGEVEERYGDSRCSRNLAKKLKIVMDSAE